MVLADAVPVVVWMVRVRVLGGFVGGGLDFGLKLELGGVGFFRSVCVVVIVIVRGIVGIVAIAIAIVIVVMVRLRRRRQLLLLTSLLQFIPSRLENVLPISICISQLPSTQQHNTIRVREGSKMTPTLILRNAFFCFSPVKVAEVLCTMR